MSELSQTPQARYNRTTKGREALCRNRTTRRNRLNQMVRDYLSEHPCTKCGESRVPCLALHHPDPTAKEGCVSNLIHQGKSKAFIVAEILKCVVLCHNCHAMEHWGHIQQAYSPQVEPIADQLPGR